MWHITSYRCGRNARLSSQPSTFSSPFCEICYLWSEVVTITTITGLHCHGGSGGSGSTICQTCSTRGDWPPDKSFKAYYSLMRLLCVLKRHPLWLLLTSACVCAEHLCACEPVQKQCLIKLSLCLLQQPLPQSFSFQLSLSLSPRLNICLSIHGWICIPFKWVPGGRLMVDEWGGQGDGCKVRVQGLLFSISLPF